MMLYNKIRIIFLIAILLLTAFFTSYIYIKKSQHIHKVEKRYMQTAKITMKHFREAKHNQKEVNLNDREFLSIIQSNDFELLAHFKIDATKKEARRVLERPIGRAKIEVLRVHKTFYLSISHPRFKVMFVDQESVRFPFELLISYLLGVFFLISLYFWLTKSLKPLKTLQHSIQKVAKGDLSVSFKSPKNDEIAQVSNAFDDALRKIEALINSRQLFLRTIMHELKTPIGKGKLLNEFLEDEQQRDSYEMVFERLELLIEEFSKIEQMLSSSYKLKLASYNMQEMLDQALELMIMSEEEIKNQVTIKQLEPFILKTDYELFSLALKNLIDNALKYSPNHKIEILIYSNKIVLSNNGEQFTQNLKEYTQPFNPKGQGLGLGLYIVQNIMELLKLEITYEYKGEKNKFTIT